MERLQRITSKQATLRWISALAMLLLMIGLLLPLSASAQHHSSGHYGGHGGHSGSRYSFGFSHGGHGSRFGLHRGGHGFSFGHSGGHRRGLHRGTSRLHGRSHRSRGFHGSRYGSRHGSSRGRYGFSRGHRDSRAYSGHDSQCESVYRRADVDGRPATIEGLRCYDEHGDAYIVPESREIVEYHDDGYRPR